MFVYTLMLTIPFLILFFEPKYLKLIRFLVLLPIPLLASLRFNTGIDTLTYREGFENLDLKSLSFVEPLYYIFVISLKTLFDNFQFFLFTQAFTCYFLTCFGLGFFEKKYPYFSIVFLPCFLVDATFNGMRYGLAFSLFIFVFGYMYKKVVNGELNMNSAKFKFFMFIPSLIHVSCLLFPFLLFRLKLNLKVIFLFTSIFIAIFIGMENYFSYKLSSYSTMEAPSKVSGLSSLVLIVLNFVFYLDIKNKCKLEIYCDFKYILSFIFFVSFLSFIFVSYSYAFLRVINICLFLSVFLVSLYIQSAKSTLKNKFFFYSFVCWLLVTGNFLRQIYLLGHSDTHSFLPYVFSEIL